MGNEELESQQSQINDQFLFLIKCKKGKEEKTPNGVIKYSVDNDEAIIALLKLMDTTLVDEIYHYLPTLPNRGGEAQIRAYIKDIIGLILPLIRTKIKKYYNPRSDNERLYLKEYTDLYDDFYAICASRSLEMFVLYMEWDLPDKDKVFTYNLNCFHGFWYYMNKMVLDGTIKNIVERCPTGYGKSYSNTLAMGFILGYDINADILKICGSPDQTTNCSTAIVELLCKKRYAKVFKYYEQFNGEEDKVFKIKQIGGKNGVTKLLVNGSIKQASILIANKETTVNGSRSKYHFFDDITDPTKASNVELHTKDINKWKTEWHKRKYDDNECYEIFSGTTRMIEDFISYHNDRLGADLALVTRENKFTSINEKTKTIFVKVPKIDFSEKEGGEITFPHKYSLEEAIRDMEDDPELFDAIDQQEPHPLEGCPFAYENLETYLELPPKNEDYACYCELDPARKGKDFVSMPICRKIDNKHFLVDVIFQQKRTEDLINEMIEKIIKHHIVKFDIENNTSTSFKPLLDKTMKERGITFCETTEHYSTENKEDKIANQSPAIVNNMVFPARGLFANGSQMGQFMKWFTSYSFEYKMKHDDAPDSLAQYVKKYVLGVAPRATISAITRERT
jgi:predicted phage terminase large subunit-like protein